MKNDFIKLIILFKVDIKYQFPNKKITWLIQNEKLMNIKFISCKFFYEIEIYFIL